MLTPMARRLEGKVALITGASRGIGKAIALRFAAEGAAVAVNYARSQERAQRLVEEIRDAGAQAIAVCADVGHTEQVASMVDTVLAHFRRVDILINNAGVLHGGDLRTMNDEKLDEMLAVNVKGIIYGVQAVAPQMIERRSGKIVNLSSIAALGTALAGTTPYAATKAAVLSLTKRFALELGPHGINVNAICPGFIRTDLVTAGRTAEELEARFTDFSRKAMLGRIGEPEDIAPVALFLASDESRFMTAQILTVDGGRMDFLTYST